jgi:DNA-binding CsgD family transcriptional regulator
MGVIREVVARADALASAPLRRRADDLLEIGRSRGAEEEPWRPLTAREFEVARLVAGGLTNAAIGERLGLSPRTVGAHVEHILAKLGFTRRAEIAAWVAGMSLAVAG